MPLLWWFVTQIVSTWGPVHQQYDLGNVMIAHL